MKDSSGKETRLPARMDPYKEQKADPPLPLITARHIYDWLMEVGPTEPGAMSQLPLSWTAIQAWAAGTFKRLSAWEFCLLRRLSAAYLAEVHAAEDHTRPAPWLPDRTEVEDRTAEMQLRAVLG